MGMCAPSLNGAFVNAHVEFSSSRVSRNQVAVMLILASTAPGNSTELYGWLTCQVVSSNSLRTWSAFVQQLSISESRKLGDRVRKDSWTTSGCAASSAKHFERADKPSHRTSWTPDASVPPHPVTASRRPASWSLSMRPSIWTAPVFSRVSSCLPTFTPYIISEKSWNISVSPGASTRSKNGAWSKTLRYLPDLARKAYCVSSLSTVKRSFALQYLRVQT
mmetsp:Transcript_84766/g.245082  ORF Transcript_84766/g.245082 Transcript_84766/m.245082 type:complete len:220 (-) Transcript_84766:289-948(-)